jgi:hypothetical protein
LKKREGTGLMQVSSTGKDEEVPGHYDIEMTEGNANYLTGNLSSVMRGKKFHPVPLITKSTDVPK